MDGSDFSFETVRPQIDLGRIQKDLQKIQQFASDSRPKTDAGRLKDACQEFEAIFIKQMLDSMRKTIPRTELIERNFGEEIFEDMLYTEYSKVLSKRGSLGIGDLLFRQLNSNASKNA
ncbi:MAG: rod-binding protein [Spirochaetales bacterium]|nr:rod-binding protein [Spirochaetales bacterium]